MQKPAELWKKPRTSRSPVWRLTRSRSGSPAQPSPAQPCPAQPCPALPCPAQLRQAKPSQAKARQGKARQGKARQGKPSPAQPSQAERSQAQRDRTRLSPANLRRAAGQELSTSVANCWAAGSVRGPLGQKVSFTDTARHISIFTKLNVVLIYW